jgi:hypothetical protein
MGMFIETFKQLAATSLVWFSIVFGFGLASLVILKLFQIWFM